MHVTRSALRYKALIDEKERYRLNLEAIFKNLKDGIITVDKDLSVVEINDSAGKICGISGYETTGKPFTMQIKGCIDAPEAWDIQTMSNSRLLWGKQ